MTRLEYTINYIRNYENMNFEYLGKCDILSGLIASLTEEDLFNLFFSEESAPKLNEQIIKRLCNDLKHGTVSHKRFISKLINECRKGSGNIQANAQVLQGISEYLPLKISDQVIRMFIVNKSKAIRNRAYRLIDDKSTKKYICFLISNWEIYRDDRVIYNLIKFCKDEYFTANYKLFLRYTEPWMERMIYNRLVKIIPKK